jgi:hypothetical protein
MKRYMIVLIGLLIICAFAGCAPNSEPTLIVEKVTFIHYFGDSHTIEMYILTSDFHLQKYVINPKDDSQIDLLGGEMPSKDEYIVEEREITESEWGNLVNILSRVDFMELEEELPRSEAYDAPSYYIQVETADDTHSSGGYNAGEGRDKANKRFKEILDEIRGIID